MNPGPTKGWNAREAFLSKDLDYLYVGVSLILTVFYVIRVIRPILEGTIDLYAIVFNLYGISLYAVTGILFFIRLPAKTFGTLKDCIVPFISFVSPTILILAGGYLEPMFVYTPASIALFLIGLALAVAAFAYLGKAFGVFPAIRQIATGGPYKAIRHPAYLGELFYLLGIVLHNVNWVSIVMFFVLTATTIGRIIIEERILSESAEYREYKKRTRYRLFPGIW